MPKYHVTFEDQKKVLVINRKEDFFATFSRSFQVNHKPEVLKLQIFDSEWDDYVDIEPQDLPEKAKVLVRLRTLKKAKSNVTPSSTRNAVGQFATPTDKPQEEADDDCLIIEFNDHLNANSEEEILAVAKLLPSSIQIEYSSSGKEALVQSDSRSLLKGQQNQESNSGDDIHYEPLYDSDRLQVSGMSDVRGRQNSSSGIEIRPLLTSCGQPVMKCKTYGEETRISVADTQSTHKQHESVIFPDSSDRTVKQVIPNNLVTVVPQREPLRTPSFGKNAGEGASSSGLRRKRESRSDKHKVPTTTCSYSQLLTAAVSYSSGQHSTQTRENWTQERPNVGGCKSGDRQFVPSRNSGSSVKVKEKSISPSTTSTSNSGAIAEYVLLDEYNGPSCDGLWPQPFIIPKEKFPWTLQAALNQKMVLWKEAKHQLLQVLYDYISPYTIYPRPYMYEVACSNLIKTYPHLLDQCPLVVWRKMLSNKFRNERKRALQKHPSVIMMKRPRDSRSPTDYSISNDQEEIEVLWPTPFIISRNVFSKELLDIIDNLDQPMNPKLQTLLLDELHKYVSTFSTFPSMAQCNEVASALLSTFTQIPRAGLSSYLAEKEWARLIAHKFETSQRTPSTSTGDVTVKAEPDFLTSSHCDMTDSMSSSETSSWYLVRNDDTDNGRRSASGEEQNFVVQDESKRESLVIQDEQISRSQGGEEHPFPRVMVKQEIEACPEEENDQLPSHFAIETLSRYVYNSLVEKHSLNPLLTGKIIKDLFRYIGDYTTYPSNEQLTTVLQQLFEAFPYIWKAKGYDEAMSTWRKMLLNKFRNERKRRLRVHPSMIMNKRKRYLRSEEKDFAPSYLKSEGCETDEIPWPSPFMLSTDIFSKELGDDINELRGPASPDLTESLLNELHAYVSTFSRVPNNYQLNEVASALLSTFPKLLCDSENFGVNKKKWVTLVAKKFNTAKMKTKWNSLDAGAGTVNFVTSTNGDLSDSMSSQEWCIVEGEQDDEDFSEDEMTSDERNEQKSIQEHLAEESALVGEELKSPHEAVIKQEDEFSPQISPKLPSLPTYKFPGDLYEVLLEEIQLTESSKEKIIIELIKYISTYRMYPTNISLTQMLEDFFAIFPQDTESEDLQESWRLSLVETLRGDKKIDLYKWMAAEAPKMQDQRNDTLSGEESTRSWSSSLAHLPQQFPIELKIALSNKKRHQFNDLMLWVLDVLYELVFKMTRNPNLRQCQEVAVALLDVFPRLKVGISTHLVVTYWTGLIMRKFDMERGRRNDDAEEEEEKVVSSEDASHRCQIKVENETSSSWSTALTDMQDESDEESLIIINS